MVTNVADRAVQVESQEGSDSGSAVSSMQVTIVNPGDAHITVLPTGVSLTFGSTTVPSSCRYDVTG
jgi:hypothetical protein